MLAATGMLAGVEACVLIQKIRASNSRSVDAVMLTKSALASTAYTKYNSNRDSLFQLLASTWGIEREASALPVQAEVLRPWRRRYPLWTGHNMPARGWWLLPLFWAQPQKSAVPAGGAGCSFKQGPALGAEGALGIAWMCLYRCLVSESSNQG